MASRKKRRPKMSEEAAAAAEDIAGQMRELGIKDGYVVFVNIGPYGHNPYDYALPDARHPKVFRALYEAVDYAERNLRYYDKLKIKRLTPSGEEWPPFYGDVVWRSWGPYETEDRERREGWRRERVAERRQRVSERKGRTLEHARRDGRDPRSVRRRLR
jgi:hypothetical protein